MSIAEYIDSLTDEQIEIIFERLPELIRECELQGLLCRRESDQQQNGVLPFFALPEIN